MPRNCPARRRGSGTACPRRSAASPARASPDAAPAPARGRPRAGRRGSGGGGSCRTIPRTKPAGQAQPKRSRWVEPPTEMETRMTDLADPPARDLADAHTAQPSLAGRKAIVTGGTTGIGRAIAVLLAAEGVKVFICGRDSQHLEDGLERIREVGGGAGIALALADEDGVKRFFEAADAYLGGLDIAIVNAAIPAQGLAEMSEDDLT